jgi:hypothetical protein
MTDSTWKPRRTGAPSWKPRGFTRIRTDFFAFDPRKSVLICG